MNKREESLTRLSGMPSVITMECPSILYVGGEIGRAHV